MIALPKAWVAPGPVAQAFLDDTSMGSGIMGPVGSGKTTAALMRGVLVAAAQRPSPIDGIRRCKGLVLRDTFVNIKRTILPTWHTWFPATDGHWVGGPPAQHIVRFDLGTGPIELTVDFMGIGDDTIENLLRSYEMTWYYANEVDLLSFDVISFLNSRLGRYPSKLHGGPTWYGGWMDFNAPEEDHWLHELFVKHRLPGTDQDASAFKLFSQPGGLDPAAENLANLPAGYYEKIVATNPAWMSRRMVHNKWGYSRDGKPVYPEFNDDTHVARAPLTPIRGVPIGIGVDAGGTPAATFGQYLPGNRWRILAEISTDPGTGPSRFAQLIVDVLGREGFVDVIRDLERGGVAGVYGWADPSAAFGEDGEGGDPAWLTTVRRKTGIGFRPTETNAPSMRQEAVRSPLGRIGVDGPAFQLSPSCSFLRKGFNSGYHYKKIKVGGATGRFGLFPEKNMYSHAVESLEYLLLGGGEGRRILTGGKTNAARALPTADDSYDMYGDAA